MVKLQLSKANQREYFVNKQGRFLSFTLLISNLEKAPLYSVNRIKEGPFISAVCSHLSFFAAILLLQTLVSYIFWPWASALDARQLSADIFGILNTTSRVPLNSIIVRRRQSSPKLIKSHQNNWDGYKAGGKMIILKFFSLNLKKWLRIFHTFLPVTIVRNHWVQ